MILHAEAHHSADYEIVSSLLGAVKAVISGLIDEHVLVVLDVLSEPLETDLAELPKDS